MQEAYEFLERYILWASPDGDDGCYRLYQLQHEIPLPDSLQLLNNDPSPKFVKWKDEITLALGSHACHVQILTDVSAEF